MREYVLNCHMDTIGLPNVKPIGLKCESDEKALDEAEEKMDKMETETHELPEYAFLIYEGDDSFYTVGCFVNQSGCMTRFYSHEYVERLREVPPK